jgi:IstB-like ATP binding protein
MAGNCHHLQRKINDLKQRTDRVVQDWGKYLGDVTMASTILDRLMHRCVMLEFEGKSYRLKEAAARLAIQADAFDLHRWNPTQTAAA